MPYSLVVNTMTQNYANIIGTVKDYSLVYHPHVMLLTLF